MLNLLMFFFMGFCGGFAIAYLINLGAASDAEADARYWRQQAINNQSDATFWQNAYAKDASK